MKRTALLFGGLVLGTAGIAHAEPVRFESKDDVGAYAPFWAGGSGTGLAVTASFEEHPVFPQPSSYFSVPLPVSSTEWNYTPQYGLTAPGPQPMRGLLVQSPGSSFFAPLGAGDQVSGGSGTFGPAGVLASASRDFEGVWGSFGSPLPDSEVRYVGLKFPIDGAQHYGWAAVRLIPGPGGLYPQVGTASGGFAVQLLAWGYESEPDTPAIAGAPSCSSADIAAPYGALTFADVAAFASAYAGGTVLADHAAPFEALTFADITAFLGAFSAGCP